MLVWHGVEYFVSPPSSKPDLWVVANVCLGAAGFGLCYLWCLWRLVDESGILVDLGFAKSSKIDSEKKRQ
jgi:alpha-1,3-glucosyltransferase